MFKLVVDENIKKYISRSYYLYFNNYFSDDSGNYFLSVNDKIVNYDEEIMNTIKKFNLVKIYFNNATSQLPIKYFIDSNILIKFRIIDETFLVFRGLIDLSKYNSSLTLQSIANITKIVETYYENNSGDFQKINL